MVTTFCRYMFHGTKKVMERRNEWETVIKELDACYLFRKLALYLCEWDLTENALKERLDRLVVNGEPERAAAMALFNNKLNWTISILSGLQNSPKTKDFG